MQRIKMASFRELLLGLIAIATLVPKVSTAKCTFTKVSENSVVAGSTDIYCLDVPEESQLGKVVCIFKALNAETVTLNPTGDIAKYIELQSINNGDNSLTISLNMTKSYSDYVDTANPTFDPIKDSFTCKSKDNEDSTLNLFVNISPENTQKPIFTQENGVYNFAGVPETIAIGIEITTSVYGQPIIAEDKDNSVDTVQYSGSQIVFEIQDGSQDFAVKTVTESAVWPYAYRAEISAKRIFDYNAKHDYNFILLAKNADNNELQKSTANIFISLADVDNLDPIFSASYYYTTVEENMITTIGGHNLDITPPIEAHDQDIGINQSLIYAIDQDCSDTPECDIIHKYFKMDPDTGHIIFVSYGSYPHDITTVSFLISATQSDNPLKAATAEVTANIQVS